MIYYKSRLVNPLTRWLSSWSVWNWKMHLSLVVCWFHRLERKENFRDEAQIAMQRYKCFSTTSFFSVNSSTWARTRSPADISRPRSRNVYIIVIFQRKHTEISAIHWTANQTCVLDQSFTLGNKIKTGFSKIFELIWDNFDVLNPKIKLVFLNQVNIFYTVPSVWSGSVLISLC